MGWQAWLTLGITALAFVLFVWNRYRPDVVALAIATLLIITGLVTPAEGVSGFANEATIAVALLLGPEFPSLLGGLIGLAVVTLAAQRGFLLPNGNLLCWKQVMTEPAM